MNNSKINGVCLNYKSINWNDGKMISIKQYNNINDLEFLELYKTIE